MKVNLAHLREKSTSGTWINFAVFDAESKLGTNSGNSSVLSQLTNKARATGLRIDQSALTYMQNGRIQFYGDKNLVDYLSNMTRDGVLQWTHTIDV